MDGVILLLLSVLAVGLLSTFVRMSEGPPAAVAVLVLFALSGLGGVAFLLGRSHARVFRARRKTRPPSSS